MAAVLDRLGAAIDQRVGLLANRLHVLLAHVRMEDELPCILVALPAQAQAQFHLGQFARDFARQIRKLLQVIG